MPTDYTNPGYLAGKFAYDTPEDDFRRFASQQPQFFQRQRGLNEWNDRMRARYMLDTTAAPGTAGFEGGPVGSSYFDYLTNAATPYGVGSEPAYGPSMQSYGALVAQAREAAEAGRTAPGAYIGDADLAQNSEFLRRSWLSNQFAGDDGAANQFAVANLLAQQRNRGQSSVPGQTGAYSGQMAQAIQNAMSTLYQNRRNVGAPKETFLDWYLSATGQGTPTTPTAGG